MCMAIGNEEYGEIEIEGKVYRILHLAIPTDIYLKLLEFGEKFDCGYRISRLYHDFEWILEDDKLFLKNIRYRKCRKRVDANVMEALFGKQMIFADWFSSAIRAVVRSEDISEENRYIFDRDIIKITFEKGVVIKREEIHEIARGGVKLKRYIEE